MIMSETEKYNILNKSSYTLLRSNNDKTIVVKDDQNYLYLTTYSRIKNSVNVKAQLRPFGKSNCYTLINIKTWIKNNQYPFFVFSGEYLDNKKESLSIKCNVCNRIWKTSWDKLYGRPHCKFCSREDGINKQKNTHEFFVNKVKELVGDEYCVLGIYEKYKKPILIKHSICNTEFFITPSNFINRKRCPFCAMSSGETEVEYFLKNNKIKYIRQKRFENCFDKRELPFDFYLPDYNLCIEYHGEQHYKPVDFGNKGIEYANKCFEECLKRDKIKENFCKKENIYLLKIPYWNYKKIEKILDRLL